MRSAGCAPGGRRAAALRLAGCRVFSAPKSRLRFGEVSPASATHCELWCDRGIEQIPRCWFLFLSLLPSATLEVCRCYWTLLGLPRSKRRNISLGNSADKNSPCAFPTSQLLSLKEQIRPDEIQNKILLPLGFVSGAESDTNAPVRDSAPLLRDPLPSDTVAALICLLSLSQAGTWSIL